MKKLLTTTALILSVCSVSTIATAQVFGGQSSAGGGLPAAPLGGQPSVADQIALTLDGTVNGLGTGSGTVATATQRDTVRNAQGGLVGETIRNGQRITEIEEEIRDVINDDIDQLGRRADGFSGRITANEREIRGVNDDISDFAVQVNGANGLRDRIVNLETTGGPQGERGVAGAQGERGVAGATGATGATGAAGQDARITVNSDGQYVVSDTSGTAVTVATDEQVTISVSELTTLIESVAATAVAGFAAESEARIEAIQAEAEARIEALSTAAQERIAIKRVAVANTVAIVSLENQWNSDPILGKFEVSAASGQVVQIEVANGVFENRVARQSEINSIADRVADNTSRIQTLENAVFASGDNESAKDRMISKLWSDIKAAKAKSGPTYIMTAKGIVDMRAIDSVSSAGSFGIKFSVSKHYAYEVMGWNSTWVNM